MQLHSLEAAIASARRRDLPALRETLWRVYGMSRQTAEDEALATALSDQIQARLAVPAEPRVRKPGRPRWSSPERAERIRHRRRLAASGPLPPQLAQWFTPGELAVLRIVGDECRDRGRCDRSVGELADRAQVSRSLVKTAIAEARRRGLLAVEERRVSRCRNLPSIITVVSAEWSTWLKRGGARKATSSDNQDLRKEGKGPHTDRDMRRAAGQGVARRPFVPFWRRDVRSTGAGTSLRGKDPST